MLLLIIHAETEWSRCCQTYSLSAWGSFCICSRIMRMAGSLIIFWTSGSFMALLFTSSGLSSLVFWLITQRWIPSLASWEQRTEEIEPSISRTRAPCNQAVAWSHCINRGFKWVQEATDLNSSVWDFGEFKCLLNSWKGSSQNDKNMLL